MDDRTNRTRTGGPAPHPVHVGTGQPGFDDAVRRAIEGSASFAPEASVSYQPSDAPSRHRVVVSVPRAVKLRRSVLAGLSVARPAVGISAGMAR